MRPLRYRETGCFIVNDPGLNGEQQQPTFRCNHCCGTIRFESVGKASDCGDRCPSCDGHVCKKCARIYHETLRCDVFWNKLARAEAADRFAREIDCNKINRKPA